MAKPADYTCVIALHPRPMRPFLRWLRNEDDSIDREVQSRKFICPGEAAEWAAGRADRLRDYRVEVVGMDGRSIGFPLEVTS